MAKYSDIKGFTVQTLSSDTVASQTAGGAWASGNNMNTGREELGGVGIQTAALAISGQLPGSFSPRSRQEVESYNGTSWTEKSEVNTGRSLAAQGGTYTSAVFAGGYNQEAAAGKVNNAETWNGASWTEVSEINSARFAMAGAGTSTTSAIAFGGTDPGSDPPEQALNEEWNGSSWTEVGDMNTRKRDTAGGGTATVALVFGGRTNPSSTVTADAESWNGTSWTEIASLNTARYYLSGGAASATDAMAFGGYHPPTNSAKTEFWNGSTWTEVGDLVTTRRSLGGASQAPGAVSLAFGGLNPSAISNATEEFTAPAVFTKQVEGQLFYNSTTNTFKETLTDIPGATWSSGANMGTARDYVGGAAASKDAALIFGGSAYNVEQYNGSTWAEKTEMNCPNAVNYSRSPMGTSTSCIAAGGSSGYSNLVEQWDGSSWTEIAELNEGRGFGSASPIGTVTAGLVAGGFESNPGVTTAKNEEWNGNSWTEKGDLNTGRGYNAGLGTSTSAMVCNGQSPPPGFNVSNTVETWDGASWTEVAEVNTARARGVAAGTTDAALYYAGATGPSTGKDETEFWDGSSWTEVADLTTARMRGGGGGGAATAIMAAGRHPAPASGATEEWEANLANKTITTS
jgi:hypothetical protein